MLGLMAEGEDSNSLPLLDGTIQVRELQREAPESTDGSSALEESTAVGLIVHRAG